MRDQRRLDVSRVVVRLEVDRLVDRVRPRRASGRSVDDGLDSDRAGSPSPDRTFARVSELRVGDRIAVSSTDDQGIEYVVREVRDFPKDELPTADVFGATATDELRLITCTGPFDRSTRHYTDNLVVFATPA